MQLPCWWSLLVLYETVSKTDKARWPQSQGALSVVSGRVDEASDHAKHALDGFW
jgi:hypothetical protein